MIKPIPNFPGYTVSSDGVVCGPDGNQLSPRKDDDGYIRVDLRRDGKRYTRFVHTLVSSAFHGESKEVDHKDGDRTNPTAANVEPVTHQENMNRMAEHNGKDAKPYKKS